MGHTEEEVEIPLCLPGVADHLPGVGGVALGLLRKRLDPIAVKGVPAGIVDRNGVTLDDPAHAELHHAPLGQEHHRDEGDRLREHLLIPRQQRHQEHDQNADYDHRAQHLDRFVLMKDVEIIQRPVVLRRDDRLDCEKF